jgi:RNA polymerase sigma-70 factor (family 1)
MRNDKQEQFKALYEKYYAPFCIYAKRYLQDKEIREDIVSDVFAKLWLSDDFVLEEETALPFLKTCVKNSCLNYLKRKTYADDYAQHVEIQLPAYADSPESIYTLDEMYKLLYDAIEKLPEKQRIVFIDTFLNDKKQKEVADELGMSVKTVSRYQMQVIERLRVELKDYLPSLALLSILISNLRNN